MYKQLGYVWSYTTFSFCDVCMCQPNRNGLIICNRLPSNAVIRRSVKAGNMTLILQCDCPTYDLYKNKINSLFYTVMTRGLHTRRGTIRSTTPLLEMVLEPTISTKHQLMSTKISRDIITSSTRLIEAVSTPIYTPAIVTQEIQTTRGMRDVTVSNTVIAHKRYLKTNVLTITTPAMTSSTRSQLISTPRVREVVSKQYTKRTQKNRESIKSTQNDLATTSFMCLWGCEVQTQTNKYDLDMHSIKTGVIDMPTTQIISDSQSSVNNSNSTHNHTKTIHQTTLVLSLSGVLFVVVITLFMVASIKIYKCLQRRRRPRGVVRMELQALSNPVYRSNSTCIDILDNGDDDVMDVSAS